MQSLLLDIIEGCFAFGGDEDFGGFLDDTAEVCPIAAAHKVIDSVIGFHDLRGADM